MEYQKGWMVKSLAGHDAGICYIILGVDGDNLYLANGKSRMVSKPKVKKKKHVQLIYKTAEKAVMENELMKAVALRIAEGCATDADLIFAVRLLKGECKCQRQM